MYCEKCGEKISDSDEYCYNCGKKIENLNDVTSDDLNKSESENTESDKSDTISWRIVFIFIFITLLIGSVSVSFLDTENQNDGQINNNTSDKSELRETWKDNDDFPDNDNINYNLNNFRNKSIGSYDMLSEGSNTTFGIFDHSIYSPNLNHYDTIYLFNVSSDDYFNVYVIEGNRTDVGTSITENPSSIRSYNHIDKYTKFKTKEYNKKIKLDANQEYFVVYTVHGVDLPNASFNSKLEFAEDNNNIELNGTIRREGFISFERFKNNENSRALMKFNESESPLD